MGEPPLNSPAKSGKQEVYRLTIIPNWGNAMTVRLERSNAIYTVSSRRLDGNAEDPGKLVESHDGVLTDKYSQIVKQLVVETDFFKMARLEDYLMSDGDQWIFEASIDKRYHFIERCCVSSGNTEERGLGPFIALCKFLIEKSQLSDPC